MDEHEVYDSETRRFYMRAVLRLDAKRIEHQQQQQKES